MTPRPQPVWLKVLHQKVLHQALADIVSTQRAMSRFTADTLQAKYGDDLGRPPLSDATTPRMLRNALLKMTPPVDISDGIVLSFEWDNKHQVRGINAPQGIHRMQRIRWIQHQIVMRGRTCRTVRYPSYAMHNMDAAWNCNVRGDLPHRIVPIEYSASDGYSPRHRVR